MIDLRSDTVTKPTAAMRAAMAAAEVGDDVYGEDPTVNRLQEMAANLVGKEAALFVTSGTQANLVGILSHCARGDEYIIGDTGHSFLHEGGGAAVVGGLQAQTVPFESDGTLDLDRVEDLIKPRHDDHYAPTRLLCLENTNAGLALPTEYLGAAAAVAARHELGTHLDGARLFNAAVKRGVTAAEIARHFDTVSFCLSKGLGAPAGSLFCGSAEAVGRAHRWRKMLGGGMRQAGVLAAAGIHALEHHVERLADDHANAARLAAGLGSLDGLGVSYPPAQTNMVFLDVDREHARALTAYLARRDIATSPGTPMRLVTHLDVSSEDVDTVVAAIADFQEA